MCLAIPGKVVEISEDKAVIDYGFEKRTAKLSVVKPRIGDYVIVSAGFVIEILDEENARKMIEAWKEVTDNVKLE